MTNFELYEQFKTAKDYSDILKIAEQEGKPMSADEARAIFEKMHGKMKLSDDELQAAVGGFRWPWEDDSNYPPPKYHIGDHVRVCPLSQNSSVTPGAVIIEISSEKKSTWGIDPEWQYKVKYDSYVCMEQCFYESAVLPG